MGREMLSGVNGMVLMEREKEAKDA